MDPVFVPFSSSGLPQGSKLSTYLTNRRGAEPSELSGNLASLNLEPALGRPAGGGLPHSASTPSFATFSPGRTFATRRVPPPDGTPPDPPKAGDEAGADAAPLFEEHVGGTTYYYTAEEAAAQKSAEPPTVTPPYTAYLTPPPHVTSGRAAAALAGAARAPAGFFVGDQLREQILKQQSLVLVHPNPQAYPELPTELDSYHELCPLEAPGQPLKSSLFGCVTTCYKATNVKTGQCCCLRRMHGLRLTGTKCLQAVGMWRKINHSSLVTLREFFTTKAFGDNSVVMVYDYYPGAETLMARHFSQPPQLNGFADPFQDPSIPRPYSAQKNAVLRQKSALMPEPLIWGYIIQLTGVLRQIHSAGLACRVLDPTKILITGQDRLHVNGCGVLDVLTFDNGAANPLAVAQVYQQEDLVGLGKLLLALSCNSVLAVQRDNFNTSISIVERHYSADLKAVIMSLLLSPSSGRQRSINDVMPMIGARFYTQLDSSHQLAERLEDELGREVQNGRLFRLLAKLSAITERPELNLEVAWAETGDRYMLKLFRDYVFHAVTEDGRPFLDMAHVVQCLNKLDAGSADKICLMSRDMQNVLVTTFSELKQCFERSFHEIFEAALAKESPAS
ncbi:PAN2-PAN3 deadenylation complex subunit pan3-like [Pollicipes pollicipes]|uniref:PAN2-PAN3 deadenylation complex subunit pan3-like n=1 Tax=Pollicipes pollicipes TaxID=41117 RepID=UPI00188496D4|nr:PAN2-PAN3 deadenylation complex subunit pan3-like [Pollicipes pollicipes]